MLIVANEAVNTEALIVAESAPSLSSSVVAATQPTFFALSVATTSLAPQSNKPSLDAPSVYHDQAIELLFCDTALLDAKAGDRNALESDRRLTASRQDTDKNDPTANKVGLSQFDDWARPSPTQLNF
jgi:hypothetical protein